MKFCIENVFFGTPLGLVEEWAGQLGGLGPQWSKERKLGRGSFGEAWQAEGNAAGRQCIRSTEKHFFIC